MFAETTRESDMETDFLWCLPFSGNAEELRNQLRVMQDEDRVLALLILPDEHQHFRLDAEDFGDFGLVHQDDETLILRGRGAKSLYAFLERFIKLARDAGGKIHSQDPWAPVVRAVRSKLR